MNDLNVPDNSQAKTACVQRMIRPRRTMRVCYNCKHWHKKEYNHCQHSGPWGGDIIGDTNCTFETKWPNDQALRPVPETDVERNKTKGKANE